MGRKLDQILVAITSTAVLLSILHIGVGQASKILMLPWSAHSHVVQMAAIGDSLTAKGHQVHMVLAESYPFAFRHKLGKIMFHTYKTKEKDVYTIARKEDEDKVKERENKERLFMQRTKLDFVDDLRTNYEGLVELCTNALADEELFDKLNSFDFDIAVVDTSPMSRCLTVIPYELGVPFVSLATVYEPWLSRTPAMPSFVPMGLQTTYREDMSFYQRLWNLWYSYDWYTSPGTPLLTHDFVGEYAPDKPWISLTDLTRQAMVWLVTTDSLLDYPRPQMANEIYVGGLTTQPARSLAPVLQPVVNASKDGTIVVCLGDIGETLPINIRDKFVAAFVTFKTYRIIWRLKPPYPKNIPQHITFTEWMPLNDLLGHPTTKLFITHAGSNVQFEALYHSIPMLMFPITGDQFYNAHRAEDTGIGIRMDIGSFQAGEMVSNMLKLLDNSTTFNRQVDKASAAFRHTAQTPKQRAVHWIEHCLMFGGDSLRSHALDMGWMEYTMMDLITLLSVFMAIGMCLFWNTITLALRFAGANINKSQQWKQNGVQVAAVSTTISTKMPAIRTNINVTTKPPITHTLTAVNKTKQH